MGRQEQLQQRIKELAHVGRRIYVEANHIYRTIVPLQAAYIALRCKDLPYKITQLHAAFRNDNDQITIATINANGAHKGAGVPTEVTQSRILGFIDQVFDLARTVQNVSAEDLNSFLERNARHKRQNAPLSTGEDFELRRELGEMGFQAKIRFKGIRRRLVSSRIS